MPRIDSQVYAPLASQGYNAYGVHIGQDVGFAISSKNDTGIGFPMLIDLDSAGLLAYGRVGSGALLFPLAYLIDKSGVINTIYTDEEPTLADLKATIEALLQ